MNNVNKWRIDGNIADLRYQDYGLIFGTIKQMWLYYHFHWRDTSSSPNTHFILLLMDSSWCTSVIGGGHNFSFFARENLLNLSLHPTSNDHRTYLYLTIDKYCTYNQTEKQRNSRDSSLFLFFVSFNSILHAT